MSQPEQNNKTVPTSTEPAGSDVAQHQKVAAAAPAAAAVVVTPAAKPAVKSDKPAKAKVEKPVKPAKTEKPAKAGKPAPLAKAEKPAKPAKPAKAVQPAAAKPEVAAPAAKAAKVVKAVKAVKADKPAPAVKPEKPLKPVKKLAAPAAAPAPAAAAVKPAHVKAKLVRDSFTMPAADYALVQQLKDRALAFQRPTKKSELLRAGLQALAALSSDALQALLGQLTELKTGRPSKGR